MLKRTAYIGLSLLIISLQATAQTAELEVLMAEGATVIDDFTASLEGELASAIQSGGAVKAMDVCHTGAPNMAAWLAEKKGATLARESLENHKPDEVSAWQIDVLKDFKIRLANGEPIEQLVFKEIADASGKHEFRMMKAMPTSEICFTCHGSKVAPNVFATLNMLYPVAGYSAREVVSAFIYVKPLD